jgi:hypothetical protein
MNNSHRPTLTTAQVTYLARVSPQSIYAELERTGEWCGVFPSKLSNGHYIWRADEVHLALGLIPERSDMTPGERAWVNFLDIEAIPLTAAIFKLGQRLLSHEADEGRHPDEGVDELSLLYEIVEAFCARADVTVPMMGESASRRAKAALALVALVASRTHEFAALESEADHD